MLWFRPEALWRKLRGGVQTRISWFESRRGLHFSHFGCVVMSLACAKRIALRFRAMDTARQFDRFLAQRSRGEVKLGFSARGVQHFREAGAAKLRLPQGSTEAILINTSGGLAGGDRHVIDIDISEGASLTVTTQAAERVYRSLGPAAELQVSLKVGKNARLCWLPQETILFEGSSLSRTLNAEMADDAELLCLESLVLGRTAMGEVLTRCEVQDSWNISRGGVLCHAERLRFGPVLPRGRAALASARAMATLVLVSPRADRHTKAVKKAIGPNGGVSCWNGKLVARLLEEDGFRLKKSLARAIAALSGGMSVPSVWAL
jgi:urease accessory protein